MNHSKNIGKDTKHIASLLGRHSQSHMDISDKATSSEEHLALEDQVQLARVYSDDDVSIQGRFVSQKQSATPCLLVLKTTHDRESVLRSDSSLHNSSSSEQDTEHETGSCTSNLERSSSSPSSLASLAQQIPEQSGLPCDIQHLDEQKLKRLRLCQSAIFYTDTLEPLHLPDSTLIEAKSHSKSTAHVLTHKKKQKKKAPASCESVSSEESVRNSKTQGHEKKHRLRDLFRRQKQKEKWSSQSLENMPGEISRSSTQPEAKYAFKSRSFPLQSRNRKHLSLESFDLYHSEDANYPESSCSSYDAHYSHSGNTSCSGSACELYGSRRSHSGSASDLELRCESPHNSDKHRPPAVLHRIVVEEPSLQEGKKNKGENPTKASKTKQKKTAIPVHDEFDESMLKALENDPTLEALEREEKEITQRMEQRLSIIGDYKDIGNTVLNSLLKVCSQEHILQNISEHSEGELSSTSRSSGEQGDPNRSL